MILNKIYLMSINDYFKNKCKINKFFHIKINKFFFDYKLITVLNRSNELRFVKISIKNISIIDVIFLI